MALHRLPKPNRRNRTFTGCLTCRRRKVKCPDTQLPCHSCCRLRLDCEAPIAKNIRIHSEKGITRLGEETNDIISSSATLTTLKPRLLTPTLPRDSVETAWSLPPLLNNNGLRVDGQECAYLQDEENNNRTFGQTILSPDPSQSMMNLSPEVQPSVVSTPRGCLLLGPDNTEAHSAPPVLDVDFQLEQIFDEPPEWLDSQLGWTQQPYTSMVALTDVLETAVNASNSFMGSSPLAVHPGLPLAAKEAEAVHHYKSQIATSFSVKDARWNIFTCLLEFDRGASCSPLKSSLIAWTATHLAVTKSDFYDLASHHYSAGSIQVTSLLEEFAKSESKAAHRSSRLRPSQISLMLTSSFFLCQRDIIVCDISGLRNRFIALKRLLKSSWHSLSAHLTAIDYRILLWLSYLDVRAATFRPPDNESNNEKSETTLLAILSKEESLKSIYNRSRGYLNEGFGDAYPSYELQGDMLQDGVNIHFAEAMSLLGDVVCLGVEQRKDIRNRRAGQNSRPEDSLHQGIREKLWDLRKECDLSLKGFLKNNQVYVTRTSYHWLNLDIICCCAIIILNRHLNQIVSTDLESQNAARDIIKTTLKLRNATMLHNPHSMFSPFPLFVAGMEIDDEVYRDWTLSLLETFSCWGLHVQKALVALRQLIKRQGELGFRCSMREIIELLGDEILL